MERSGKTPGSRPHRPDAHGTRAFMLTREHGGSYRPVGDAVPFAHHSITDVSSSR